MGGGSFKREFRSQVGASWGEMHEGPLYQWRVLLLCQNTALEMSNGLDFYWVHSRPLHILVSWSTEQYESTTIRIPISSSILYLDREIPYSNSQSIHYTWKFHIPVPNAAAAIGNSTCQIFNPLVAILHSTLQIPIQSSLGCNRQIFQWLTLDTFRDDVARRPCWWSRSLCITWGTSVYVTEFARAYALWLILK